jgi:feruloyl esterase
MGGRGSTREFIRFFMLPGMGHCGGGAGANDFDYLSYLEEWVEHGHAPEHMIGTHIDWDKFIQTHAGDTAADEEKAEADLRTFMRDPANRTFSRPVYLYPAYAKYKGAGDPNKAESFVSVQPK